MQFALTAAIIVLAALYTARRIVQLDWSRAPPDPAASDRHSCPAVSTCFVAGDIPARRSHHEGLRIP